MPVIQVLLLVMGIALFMIPVERPMVAFIYCVSLSLVGIVILAAFENIILASRLFLLYLVGAYPLGVKLIDENLYFSVYEFNTQGLDIAITMYALTLVAIPGCWIGWWGGSRIHFSSRRAAPDRYGDSYYTCVFYLCAAFAVLLGYVIISSSTGTILDSAYGTGTEGAPAIGSASAIGGVALAVAFYCALRLNRRWLYLVTFVAGFYLLIWCQIIRGLRQDVVGVVFAMVVLYFLHRTGRVEIKFKYILYVLPAMALLELWGLVRSGLNLYLDGGIDTTELLDMGLGNAAVMGDVVYSGTLGPITTTFANTVYLVQQNELDFIYGRSYLEFFLRSPPEFLYPDRPLDYATIFPQYGLSSGGGFFELAEAYLNFGLVGAFIMPLLITFVISFLYFQTKRGAGLFYVFALSSLLAIWMRGAWYQTFAYYKSFLAAALLFCAIHFIASIVSATLRRRAPAAA